MSVARWVQARPRWVPPGCAVLAALATAASVLMRLNVPMTVGASHIDALLFIRQAKFLSHGHWLGPFGQLTLAKGPAYPALIAYTHQLGIPLKAVEQVTFLLAAFFLAACVWIVSGNLVVSTVIYAVVALDPVNFAGMTAGVMRDGWYGALSLLFAAASFVAVYGAMRRIHAIWWVLSAVVAGFAGAGLWLCREEGVSVLPTVIVIVVALPLTWLLRHGVRSSAREWRSVLRRGVPTAVAAVLIVAAFAGPVIAVAERNHDRYGVTLTNDMGEGTFAAAFDAWQRVEAGPFVPAVPITTVNRDAVYRVSPAARLLRPVLESPRNPWRLISCAAHNQTCDIAGFATAWAIRDAVAQVGKYSSGSASQRYFQQLADQIQKACTEGRIRCARRLPASLQPLAQTSAGTMTSGFGSLLGDTLWSRGYYDISQSLNPVPPVARAETRALVPAVPASQTAYDRQVGNFLHNAWPYRVLAWIFHFVLPILVAFAVLGTLLAVFVRRSRRSPLFVLAWALVLGIVLRTLLLDVLNLTQFFTDQPRYGIPTHLFLLAFAVVGTALLLELRPRRSTGSETLSEQASADQPVA